MPSAPNTPPPQYTPPEVPTKCNNISRAVAKIITNNFLDDFKTVVLKHDPNLKGSKEVDAWRQKKAEEIYRMIKAREGVFASVPVIVPGLAKKDIAVGLVALSLVSLLIVLRPFVVSSPIVLTML